jgi:hypothetical protein
MSVSGAGELTKTLNHLRATWSGFNAARGERNLTRLMTLRGERFANDAESLRRDVQYWQLLADDNYKNRYPLAGTFPIPKWGNRALLNEPHQLKMSKRIRSRLVNVVSAVLGDPVVRNVNADDRGNKNNNNNNKPNQ